MKNFQRATLACSASVIAALCLIAPASANNVSPGKASSFEKASSVSEITQVTNVSISAPATAKVSFDRTAVKSVAAPKPPVIKKEAPKAAPAVAAQTSPVVAVATEVAPVAPVSAPAPVAAPAQAAPAVTYRAAQAPVAAPAPTPAAPVAKAPVASSGKGAVIAAAALGQLGVAQDCTRLATNSLKAAGINFHGWPAGYLSLGSTVSAAEAKPGDLVYYKNGGMGLAHIAVYVGNGQAVHGGWNGGTTALFSVNVGSGPVFIRV